MALDVGSVVEGRVTGLTHFGAFVELPDGQTGLVHISEVAEKFVHDIHDYLKENQIVKVKILSIDKGRISLSIKQTTDRRKKQQFEDRLARFIKDSDERLASLKRNVDSKRGGRGSPYKS
ncbi:MAG: S1 RNA-binding domain-containing protein [Firmicutes bacterium]|nr:S1 RNA-binding domain-containing protein [Bacillota bacterium]